MKLHHLTILARDVARTRKFYCDGLGLEEVDFGVHSHDPGTHELVLRDRGGVFWTFHFYPRAHRSVKGKGGVARLLVGGEGVRPKAMRDPDGVDIELVPDLPAGLVAVDLVSDCSEFWSGWGDGGLHWLRLRPARGAEPHQMGYGSIHHLGMGWAHSAPLPRDLELSASKQTRWGESRYLYSPCGMLVELVAE